jgi:hypothetical protein
MNKNKKQKTKNQWNKELVLWKDWQTLSQDNQKREYPNTVGDKKGKIQQMLLNYKGFLEHISKEIIFQ